MFETRADNPGTVLYLQTIFSASVILHEILLWGRYVVQDKLKGFFFFQLLGMSIPHCPAFRSRGCVHSRELIWMEVCPPRRLRLPAQPGLMMGLLRTSPITSCRAFVSLFRLHHQWGFPQCTQPTVPWLSPCRQSLCSWRMRPWWLQFPSPSAQSGCVLTTLEVFLVSVWWGFWGKSHQSEKPTPCLWFTRPSHSPAVSCGK